MSARRLKIKPIANLTARRVKTEKTNNEKPTEEQKYVNVEKEEVNAATVDKNVGSVNPAENQPINANKRNDETENSNDEIAKSEKSISQPQNQDQSIVPTPTNRRRIKPIITLPQRKTRVVPTFAGKKEDDTEKVVKCDIKTTKPESEVHDEIQINEPIDDIISPASNESNKISNFEEPIDDSVFKSPQNFLSPRYNPPTPKTNPFGSEISPLMLSTNEITFKDDLRCPLSPTKIRQRIKAVPMLGNRRNSVQGREEGDEIPRRQRHLSSSSSHSNQNVTFNYKTMNSPGYPYSNRIRTESSCSNASDISVVKEVMNMTHKSRRLNRSEEHHRLNEAKRGFRERFQNTVLDKSKLKMYDMIFYNPTSNPMKNAVTIKEDRRASSAASSISSFVGKRDPSIPGPTPQLPVKSKSEENAMPVPQLKIGPNGDIIIDEKSLVIETTSEKTARETLANSDIVYDDEFSGTQGFYKRQMRMRDWGRAETIKFYRCLQTIGTDFSMMIQLFPTRSRRELKLKFKKEEKINSGLINKALLCPKTFNIEELEQDFKHDEEVERLEAEKMKLARQQQLNTIISLSKAKAQKRVYKSRTFQYLQKGDFIYENENILNKSLVKHRRTRSKVYETRGTSDKLNQSSKRPKLDESNVSHDQRIIESDRPDPNDESDHDELNNNNDENIMYTPNLNLPENNHSHVVPSVMTMEHENTSSELSNGNGFTTLVNKCGKSYFSSDMTKKSFATPESTSSRHEMADDSDGDGLIIDTESNELDEENGDVKSPNNNKTDMLTNTSPSNSISTSGDYDSEFLNNLVAVEIADASDSSNKQYKFFTIVPETGDLSEELLDLPPDVVETIITNCCKK